MGLIYPKGRTDIVRSRFVRSPPPLFPVSALTTDADALMNPENQLKRRGAELHRASQIQKLALSSSSSSTKNVGPALLSHVDNLTFGPEAEQFEAVKKFTESSQGELVGALIAAGVDGVEVQSLHDREGMRHPNLGATREPGPDVDSEWRMVPLAPPPVVAILRSSSDASKFFGVLTSSVAQCQTLLRQKLANQLSVASDRTLLATDPIVVTFSEALLQQSLPPGLAMKFVVMIAQAGALRLPFDISLSIHDKYNHLVGNNQTYVPSILGSSSFACDVIMNKMGLPHGDVRSSPLGLAFHRDKGFFTSYREALVFAERCDELTIYTPGVKTMVDMTLSLLHDVFDAQWAHNKSETANYTGVGPTLLSFTAPRVTSAGSISPGKAEGSAWSLNDEYFSDRLDLLSTTAISRVAISGGISLGASSIAAHRTSPSITTAAVNYSHPWTVAGATASKFGIHPECIG